ncbi:hypothetical protein [Nocardia sp. NPDC050435]|uniref:hypothetical protein n=1 Tax=Nocardia sp. NPDC050435 TaxID=3155040 RepID=UPI0033C5EA8C
MNTEIHGRTAPQPENVDQRSGWAILLPGGRMWAEPVSLASNPAQRGPDVWPTQDRAQEALENLRRAVIETYDPTEFEPRLVRWINGEAATR